VVVLMGSLGSALPSAASSPIFRRRSPRTSRTYTFGGSFLPRLLVSRSLALVVERAGASCPHARQSCVVPLHVLFAEVFTNAAYFS
jgi:hypothetical protein